MAEKKKNILGLMIEAFFTVFAGMFGFFAAYFVQGIILAILIAIVYGGYKVKEIGKKKKDKKDKELGEALDIIGMVIMAIGGIPLIIFLIPMIFSGIGFSVGRGIDGEIVDNIF